MEYIEGEQLFDKILSPSMNTGGSSVSGKGTTGSHLNPTSTGSDADIGVGKKTKNKSRVAPSSTTDDVSEWFQTGDSSASYLSCERAKKYFSQIISALGHCHAKFIAHRDIKLENILVDKNDNIKIVDFGLADFMKSKCSTFCGSMFYIAPEILEGRENYSPIKSDIWSLGVVLYSMLTGKLPFGGINNDIVMKKILSSDPFIPHYIVPQAADLLLQMLNKVPAERITLSGIREHPWCEGYVLPLYLPEKLLNIKRPRFIDNKVIDKMVKMGYDDVDVIIAIRRSDATECAVVYHALCEKYNVDMIIREMISDLDNGDSGLPKYSRAKSMSELGSNRKDMRGANAQQSGPVKLRVPNDPESPELMRKGQIKTSSMGTKILEKFTSMKRLTRSQSPAGD
jgi:serine/threonine protein kinase